MRNSFLALVFLSGFLTSVFAAHNWVGPLELKAVSYDQDDFPKKRLTVTVLENNNIYRLVTNDSNYPQADSDGLKTILSLLLTAQSQGKKVYLLCENLDANGNWRFVGAKI